MINILKTNIYFQESAADFLFVLCKENVDRLVKYTGYGNAAGLLVSRGLMAGGQGNTEEYSSDDESSDTEEYSQVKDQIDPITGSYPQFFFPLQNSLKVFKSNVN